MRADEQLAIGTVIQDALASAGDRLLAVVREAIATAGKQGDDLAHDLGVDPGQLSRALNCRGIHFSARWLPAVIHRDQRGILIRHLCRLAGGEFIEAPRLTADQRLALLEKACRDSGAAGAAILTEAFGGQL